MLRFVLHALLLLSVVNAQTGGVSPSTGTSELDDSPYPEKDIDPHTDAEAAAPAASEEDAELAETQLKKMPTEAGEAAASEEDTAELAEAQLEEMTDDEIRDASSMLEAVDVEQRPPAPRHAHGGVHALYYLWFGANGDGDDGYGEWEAVALPHFNSRHMRDTFPHGPLYHAPESIATSFYPSKGCYSSRSLRHDPKAKHGASGFHA